VKRVLWIAGLSVFVLALVVVFAVTEITTAQYAGARPSAQAALDTTPLQKVEDVTPITAGMNGFWITGPDKRGRQLYVWTEDEKVVANVYADTGLSKEAAIEKAKAPVYAKKLVRDPLPGQELQPVTEVVRALPAPVLPGSKTEYRTAESKFVWEIYGKLANGHLGYTYLDFKSGEVLWQIALTKPTM
jgi:uncharacterized protein YpmB